MKTRPEEERQYIYRMAGHAHSYVYETLECAECGEEIAIGPGHGRAPEAAEKAFDEGWREVGDRLLCGACLALASAA